MLLDAALDVTTTPDAGRVHQPDLVAFPFHQRVHAVARRPGRVVHQCPRLAKQRIQQGRLAHVRPPHNGNAGPRIRHGPIVVGRQALGYRIQ